MSSVWSLNVNTLFLMVSGITFSADNYTVLKKQRLQLKQCIETGDRAQAVGCEVCEH